MLVLFFCIYKLFINLKTKNMFAYNRHVAAHRAIAMLLALALVTWGLGAQLFTHKAEAANLTSVSDTLSDSMHDSASNHTIAFTSPNGMAAGATITVTFPAGFTNVAAMAFGDVDLTASGTDQTIAATNGSGQWGAVFSGQVLTLTSPSNVGQASNTPYVLELGTNATFGVTGDTQIVNPTATTTSYEIQINGTAPDSGRTRVAITDNVVVSAVVNTTLTFVVSGTAASSTVNGSPTTTSSSTSSTRLPFGVLTAGVSKTLAQDLTITTNAANGYVVTLYQDSNLQSSTGADIDNFIDGANTYTPTAWTSPTAIITNEATWGHWGITSDDATTTRAALDEFDSNEWSAPSSTPIVVMSHTGPADGATQGTGIARVGFQVQISSLQEAGDDYNTTLTYIATPTF